MTFAIIQLKETDSIKRYTFQQYVKKNKIQDCGNDIFLMGTKNKQNAIKESFKDYNVKIRYAATANQAVKILNYLGE